MSIAQATLAPPRRSSGPSPLRGVETLRRTTSIDVSWPAGWGGGMRLLGRARDLLTSQTRSEPRTIAEDSFQASVGADSRIVSIVPLPPITGLETLFGQSAGGGFRKALHALMTDKQDGSRPLWLVLDDVPGAMFVSSVAWSEWDPEWKRKAFGNTPMADLLKAREGVCIGHAPGSSAQNEQHHVNEPVRPDAAELTRSDDPKGWHAIDRQAGVAFRRARRIDLAVGELVTIDAEFQDSVTRPSGGRAAVHEYGLRIAAHRETFEVLSIDTDPRVLPYAECPAVSANLSRLLGLPLGDLRQAVPASLAGVEGCTHLNDALRALADVPVLLRHLA